MRCLESIGRQTLRRSAFEAIVVDDGSTDDTRDTVREFQRHWTGSVEYARGPHRGPATSRNLGIRTSKAEIVAFIDDDCLAEEGWLRNLIPRFSDASVGGVEGQVIPQGKLSPLGHWVSNRGGGQYLTANVAYRRDLLLRIQGFDEGYPVAGGEDYDLAYRVLESGHRIVFEAKAVVHHPVSYQSFRQFLERRHMWWSNVRLWRKHPEAFKRHSGRTGNANLLFYMAFFPAYQLFSWREWFVSHPRDLPFFSLRMTYQAYYLGYVLIRTLLGLLPRDV